MKLLICGVASLIAASLLGQTSDYMESKAMTLTVLEKYLPAGGYRSPARPVMVLKTEDGRIFDEYVSFATFYRFSNGDRIVMDLRRFDIQQTAWENAVYVFGSVLLFSLGIALCVVGSGRFLWERYS